ncbi:MAG: NAD-dependent epimerase/dehydratase family protein [Candidatus Liptonbacteria bacterium]
MKDILQRDIVKEDCERILKLVDFTPLRGKSVLITGANGFIGSYLFSILHYANEKLNLKCKVKGVSLTGAGRRLSRFMPNKYLSFARDDLSKPFKISGKYDLIFHAACYGQPARFIEEPLQTISLNVDTTRTLLEIARKSKGTFVFFSSAEIYGEIPKVAGGIDESFTGSISTLNPRAVYGESKRLGETLCAAYANFYKVNARVARISHLYGPGISIHDTRVLGDFLRKALLFGNIELLDSGDAVKTWGYIGDAATMLFHVALHGKEMVYHVGGKDIVSIRALAEKVAEETGAKVILPDHARSRRLAGADPRFVGLNTERVRKEMRGFNFTPFEQGIKRMIEWNKEEFGKEISSAKNLQSRDFNGRNKR